MATDEQTPLVSEIHIVAPPELVSDYFVNPSRMLQWMGISAELDPLPGGVFRVDLNGRNIALGVYLEVNRPRRVVMTFGWDEPGHPMPPGSTRLEVELIPDANGTLVRLSHHNLPSEMTELHRQGWSHYLERLSISASGGDPGRDTWTEPPAQAE